VLGNASDRVSAQLGKVMADVARVERAKSSSPILLTRLLAHQAQLLEQQRMLSQVRRGLEARGAGSAPAA
jgi:hypothetical protein